VSLGSSLCLNLYKNRGDGAVDPTPAWRILQEPRSLLVTTQELYTEYLHGIDDIEEDTQIGQGTIVNWSLLKSPEEFVDGRNPRSTRTSLTFRDVLQVSRAGDKLGFLHKR
jgi:alkylated DNA repair protein alkB family protein 6